MPGIIEVVLPTFFAIFVGYMVGKLSRMDMTSVVDVTLYIGVPALVFVSLVDQEIVLADAARMWASSAVIMLGCLLVAWLVFGIFRKKHSGLYVSISLMNSVNIPFPVIYLAYGAEGLAGATLFYIPNVIFIYTLGIYIMVGKGGKENVKEVLRQPVVYAAVAGLLLNFLDVNVPALAISSLDFISKLAIPLVLLVLGHNLSRARLTSLPTTLLACFLRMGVGLAIGLGIVAVLDITGVYRSVVILEAAMPAAAASAILAAKYRSEAEMVSSVVFLTTLISLVTIPFLLHWLG